MRRVISIVLAFGVAATFGLQLSVVHAKRHLTQDEDEAKTDGESAAPPFSASCGFSESKTIGNADPKRSMPERCENRASEMCIFGFGSRGFKPYQIHLDPAIHSACQSVTTPKALECVTNLRKALNRESGGKSVLTGGKRRNRIVHLPALSVLDISRCASE